jgi:GMP synthase (glutamine-hydrolysing)
MQKPLRLLVVEGNIVDDRERYRIDSGLTPSASYADTLQKLLPGCVTDICMPADEGANLPDGQGLSSYDGVVLTGSSLHLYNDQPAVRRQVELMRAVYASGTPAFGSCWGIQIGAAAAGGTVTANPTGREIGFARRVTRTEAGTGHPLLAGRPASFDAPAVHLDAITALPGDITVLAANALTGVQAAEIRHDGGTFWGVQYHPEFDLREVALILARMSAVLVSEGFRRSIDDAKAYVADLLALHENPDRHDLAWAHGLDRQVLDPYLRLTEIRNFLEYRVKPVASRRGRA